MSLRPVIGIVAGFVHDRNHLFPGHRRTVINEDYARSVAAAGGTPLLIPVGEDLTLVPHVAAAVDAVVLAGGDDVDPAHFGQPMHPLSGEVTPERDAFELALVAEADRRRMPLLGICRGMQVVNVARGGTLHQDLGLGGFTSLKHAAAANPGAPVHDVTIDPGSALAGWSEATTARVNSFHHQGVDVIGRDLVATAHAPDGVVEALEDPRDARVVAVQWHPELMTHRDPVAQGIFRGFARLAARHLADGVI